jgi:hypothetical protein
MTKPSRIEQEALRVLLHVTDQTGSGQTGDGAGTVRLFHEAASPFMLSPLTEELDKLDEFSRRAVIAKLIAFFEAAITLQPGESCEPFPGVRLTHPHRNAGMAGPPVRPPARTRRHQKPRDAARSRRRPAL